MSDFQVQGRLWLKGERLPLHGIEASDQADVEHVGASCPTSVQERFPVAICWQQMAGGLTQS